MTPDTPTPAEPVEAEWVAPDWPTAHTTADVDLAQLAAEMGGAPLTAVTDETGTIVTCMVLDVTVEDLEAAVTAHTPTPPPAPLDPVAVQAQLDELADLVMGMI